MATTEAQLAPLPEAEQTPNGTEPKNKPRGNAKAKQHDDVEIAKGEVVDDSKQIDWHGLGLTLPKALPASMMFDMIEQEVTGDDAASGSAAVHTVYKLLGREQWAKAKRHADEIGLSADDFSDFINSVFSAYGMSAGESRGSSTSSGSGGDS